MTREESMYLSGYIGRLITERAPVVSYTDAEVNAAKCAFSDADIGELCSLGLLRGNSRSAFEAFYVVRRFCEEYGVSERADGDYLACLFSEAQKQDAAAFCADPYLTTVKPKEKQRGKIRLRNVSYVRGELFQYDEPDFDSRLVVPKLGFFDRTVTFPAIYEGSMPWMSICPSEINSMRTDIAKAHGNVLVLGLGLGYYPFVIAEKKAVTSVTVVELNPDIIGIFRDWLFPYFPKNGKIRPVVCADAIDFLRKTAVGVYDTCFADIWEGAVDGAEFYPLIKKEENRLAGTDFSYWMEPQICAYLREK